MNILKNPKFFRACACLALAALAGCGSASNAHQPSATTARAALDSALSAWKNGEAADTLATKTPPVQAVDSHWRAGAKLSSYEVVKEEPGEGDQRFTVSLTETDAKAKTKAAPTEVTYIVIGRDPVWVYRDEDYARFLNMDDNPTPGGKKARKK